MPADIAFEDRIGFPPDLQIGDIETIRRVHRYAIVWPSVHKDSGDTYWWLNHDLQIIGVPPNVDDITAELPPAAWIEGLCAKPGPPDLGSLDGSVDVKDCLTTGDPSPRVAQRLAEAIRDCNTGDATSRHDTTRDHVLALLRFGKDGETGVYNALLGLRALFVAAVTRDGSRTHDEATREFDRYITNKRAARLLAEPSPGAWGKSINTAPPAFTAQKKRWRNSECRQHCGRRIRSGRDPSRTGTHRIPALKAVRRPIAFFRGRDRLALLGRQTVRLRPWQRRRGPGSPRHTAHLVDEALRDKELTADIRKCESDPGIRGVLSIASALSEFASTTDDVDADPWLLNATNGTADLRTMELRPPHNPSDRITKSHPQRLSLGTGRCRMGSLRR